MRKAIPLLATVLSGLLIASVAHAQKSSDSGKSTKLYKWTDDKGVTHYGDSVPAEYSQREQSVLNSQGLEVQKRLAEMTPAQAAAYAAQQKEESRRKQHDMFLISTYPSVKEIENVRDVRLDQINGQITAAEAYIASPLPASTASSSARSTSRPTTRSPTHAACLTISPRKWCVS